MLRRLLMMMLLVASSFAVPAVAPASARPHAEEALVAAATLAAPPRPAGHCYSDAVALGIPPGPIAAPPIIERPVPEKWWDYFNLPGPRGDLAWRLIYVANGHTIVAYTEDFMSYPRDAIIDTTATKFTPIGNADENANTIPDYAERLLSCFDRAFERLDQYFQPDIVTRNLLLNITTETTKMYPVVLRNDLRGGQTMNTPFLSGTLGAPFSTIHSQPDVPGGSEYLKRSTAGDLPGLEPLTFHELYHAFQGVFAVLWEEHPWQWMNFWTYESTAVYATDQAFLPPCTTAPNNPPWIGGHPAPGADCRTPQFPYERASEQVIPALYNEPHRSLFNRDDSNRSFDYGEVLFWYFAQAHMPVNDPDLVHAFIRNGMSDTKLINTAGGSTAFGQLYHDFMVDNYLRTLDAARDNPYYQPWWPGGRWWVESRPTAPDLPLPTGNKIMKMPDIFVEHIDTTPANLIEEYGTRYYEFVPDSDGYDSIFEITFPSAPGSYIVSALHVHVDAGGVLDGLIASYPAFVPNNGSFLSIPNVAGTNSERIILVISKVGASSDKPTLKVERLDPANAAQARANPSLFSPNGDGRYDTTAISYFLPPFPSSESDNLYEVSLTLDPGPDERYIGLTTQAMSQTHVYTWHVALAISPGEGEHPLRIRAQEAPGGIPNGQFRTYTATVTIDTTAPPEVTNLRYEAGTSTGSSGTLRWDPVNPAGDNSPGGFHYLIYRAPAPLGDLNALTPDTAVSTDSSRSIPTTGATQYFAVVSEDAAGNRSAPVFAESEAGKVDVVLIVDDSDSMPRPALNAALAGNIALINRLEDGDGIAIRDIANLKPHLEMTQINNTTRTQARHTIAGYNIPNGLSPIDEALDWAVNQLSNGPGNGRARIIVVFSDGNWDMPSAAASLAGQGISMFVVSAPTMMEGAARLQQLVELDKGSVPESQLFASPDITANYQTIAALLRGQVFEIRQGQVPAGGSREFSYPIDPSMPQATIRISWNVDKRPPTVTLTSPNGTTITSSSHAPGVTYSSTADSATYTLQLPPATPGVWKVRVQNPPSGSGPYSTRPNQSGPPGALDRRTFLPLLLGGALVSSSIPAPHTASGDPDTLDFALETAANSTLTTTLRLADPPALDLAVFHQGRPLTDTTFVWVDLVDTQGITETFILFDDGRHGDGAPGDGHYGTPITDRIHTGLYQARISLRHYDHERGYFERRILQELFLTMPDPRVRRARWSDGVSSDSSADPGDTIRLSVDLFNQGGAVLTDTVSTITTESPGVTIMNAASAYPPIAPGATGANTTPYSFTLAPDVAAGTVLTFTQVISAEHTFTNTLHVPLGVPWLDPASHFSFSGAPVAIPDANSEGGRARFYLDGPGTIGNISTRLHLTHPAVGDLTATLISPQGTAITLSDHWGGASHGFVDTQFDDAATTSIADGSAPFTGTFRPEEPLTTLVGEPIRGWWDLLVVDSEASNTGNITGWSLDIRPLRPICTPQGQDVCMRWSTDQSAIDESAGSVTLTATLDAPTWQAVQVAYRSYRGTAQSPIDYAVADGVLTFAPGETSKAISIPIADDLIDEPDESFTVRLTSLGDAFIQSPGTITTTIIDDDSAPTVAFNRPTLSTRESAVTHDAIVDAQLSHPSAYTITVDYTTYDGTALAGSDYTTRTGTLTFTPEQTTRGINIPIAGDSLNEPPETFQVGLSNPTNAVLGSSGEMTVTIRDICYDAYEPDDDLADAKPLAPGETQERGFCGWSDIDWAVFTAEAGTTYRIETLNLSSGLDTVLALYAADGSTLVAWDDDSGNGLAARIETTLAEGGIYYVEAHHYTLASSSRNYDLRLSVIAEPPTATPTPTVAPTVAPGTCSGGSGSILREYWNEIEGNEISSLTGSPDYPDNSSGSSQPASFEAPSDLADSYGTRMRGYLCPPVSGSYTFWIASDDNGELWLSTSADPADRVLIASVPDWTDSHEWNRYASQQSVSITLVGGQRYYIEALQKDGAGGDHLAVAWEGPGISQEIIPGTYLSPPTGATPTSTPTPTDTPTPTPTD